MKKHLSLFLSLLLLLLMTSCYTTIFVGKTLEPEIRLEKENNEITFVNLFDYTLPAYVKENNEISYYAGVKKLSETLSSIEDDKTFRFSIADTLKKGIGLGKLTSLLPVDYVKSVCLQNNANILLALDSMQIFFDWETIVETDEKGNKSKTKNFFLYSNFYVSLYSSSGEIINRSQLEESSFYKSRPTLSAIVTIQPSIAKAREEVERLAFLAGNDYIDKFYPKTLQIPRKINSGKPFKESNACIKEGNWERAIKLLEELQKSPDPKIAEKASQNLSVVKEAAASKQN